jgi:Fe-coproporphyrin III synthase
MTMERLSQVGLNLLVRTGQITNRTLVMPILIFYPTSRCNSRCVSCDWWKSTGEDDMTFDEIARMTGSLPALGTRVVAFSGGEPLLRPDLFAIADHVRRLGMSLHLLTSGVLLRKHARDVVRFFARVTISLDASTAVLYEKVRGIVALEAVEAGVARLRELAPALPVTARATLHKSNYRELPRLIAKARAMGLDGISFLAADLSSTAFGRQGAIALDGLKLDPEDVAEFRWIVEDTIESETAAFATGFVTDGAAKLRRLPEYYAAVCGSGRFPAVACDAPWISAVVEANGGVRPCFFHPPIGNVREAPLTEILRRDLRAFRRNLDVSTNPVCERCVCSIKVGLRSNLCE